MPRFGPVNRQDFIRYLRALGFAGPYHGRKHQFMVKSDVTLRLPNPHRSNIIGKEFLSRILRQARIDLDIWEKL